MKIIDQTLIGELCIATGLIWRVEPVADGLALVTRIDDVEVIVTGEDLHPPTEGDTSFGINAWSVYSNELIVDDGCTSRDDLVSAVGSAIDSLTPPRHPEATTG